MEIKNKTDKIKTRKKAENETFEVSLTPLAFKDALSALLEVRPVDNKELITPKKKKRKPPKK